MIPLAIALIVQDNLEVACSAIEKAAMERVVTYIDEGFAQAYGLRRRHREVSTRLLNLRDRIETRAQPRNVQGFWDLFQHLVSLLTYLSSLHQAQGCSNPSNGGL